MQDDKLEEPLQKLKFGTLCLCFVTYYYTICVHAYIYVCMFQAHVQVCSAYIACIYMYQFVIHNVLLHYNTVSDYTQKLFLLCYSC